VDWLVLAGLIGITYGTLPFGPSIINSAYSIIGEEMFASIVLIITVFGAIATLVYTSSIFRFTSIGHIVRIVSVAGILSYMARFITIPAERLHFIQYALLAVAIERVLRPHIQDAGRPFIAMLSAYFIGMGDETIQWILPNRHGEIMDVFLNGWGGVLGISLLPWPQQGLPSASHRLMFVMLTIAVISSILFTFGTRDFGHMIVDESEGFRFRSRLSPEDLREYDLKNGTSLGRVLRQEKGLRYPEFLRKYPANKYPFLHEMRVHIFCRDQHAENGSAKSSWIALRENQILESYFGRTLAEAGLNWSDPIVGALKGRCSAWKRSFYTSSVSKKVITAFSSFQLGVMSAGLVVLNGMLFLITRRWLHVG
jgi:hypothetical protein